MMNDFLTGAFVGALLGLFDQWFCFICLCLLELLLVAVVPANAHCYSIWHYPYPQRCGYHVAQAQAPAPPPKPADLHPPSWLLMPNTDDDVDIPLPSLEGMEFPPDCIADWCERLKGIGMLREKFGTN